MFMGTHIRLQCQTYYDMNEILNCLHNVQLIIVYIYRKNSTQQSMIEEVN